MSVLPEIVKDDVGEEDSSSDAGDIPEVADSSSEGDPPCMEDVDPDNGSSEEEDVHIANIWNHAVAEKKAKTAKRDAFIEKVKTQQRESKTSLDGGATRTPLPVEKLSKRV